MFGNDIKMVNNKNKSNKIEKQVAFNLLNDFPNANIEINHTNGIDLIFKLQEIQINIEVKSCKTLIKNNNSYRKGRFYFQKKDFKQNVDLFCLYLTNLNIMKFISKESLIHIINTYYNSDLNINQKITFDKIYFRYTNSFKWFLKHFCFNKSGNCSFNCKYCPY